MSCGRIGLKDALLFFTIMDPTCSATLRRAEEGAVGVAEPNGATPNASRRHAMVDAVP